MLMCQLLIVVGVGSGCTFIGHKCLQRLIVRPRETMITQIIVLDLHANNYTFVFLTLSPDISLLHFSVADKNIQIFFAC